MKLSNAKVIGIDYGISKKHDNKEFSIIFFDVTDYMRKSHKEFFGTYISTLFCWNRIDKSCLGQSIPVIVDNFGKVVDIVIKEGE